MKDICSFKGSIKSLIFPHLNSKPVAKLDQRERQMGVKNICFIIDIALNCQCGLHLKINLDIKIYQYSRFLIFKLKVRWNFLQS